MQALQFNAKLKPQENLRLIQVDSGVNIILYLIPDGIGLESTFWALKYTLCVIVNLNKLIVYVYYTSGLRTAFGVYTCF